MFCSECGAKNQKEDSFCAECGAPLVQEQEQEEQKQEVVTSEVAKTKQPMSKKNKMILGFIIIFVLLLVIGYKMGSDATSPKKVASDYINASIHQDSEQLYQYLEIDGDKTFVSKKIFDDLLKENNIEVSTIENYKITGVEYGKGKLTAKVSYTYTMKDSTKEKTDFINLTKKQKKKLLLFDDWKITDTKVSSAIIKDYTIKVTKGSIVTYAGVELTDRYLDKEQTTSKLDVYVLPQVFATKTTLKSILPSGMEIEESVTPSSYYNIHTVNFNKNNLTEDSKEKITNKAKEVLTTIYTNAIGKKPFSEFKSSFEYKNIDLTNLETSYNTLLTNLEGNIATLTNINFKDTSIYSLRLTNDGYLEVEVRTNYTYTVSYTGLDNEVKTSEKLTYAYMTVILSYDQGEYHAVGVDDLKSYFYR